MNGARAAFAAALAARFGVRDDEPVALDEVLERRVRAAGLEATAYVARLASDPRWAEWRALAMALSVAESGFFRHHEHFDALAEVVLPELARRGGRARILSAGCASGEEPYTLAMVLERAALDAEIVAFDMSAAALERARAGRYGRWALRELPEAERVRFDAAGDTWTLREPLRARVRFEERNVIDDDPAFWRTGAFDVIFCRNLFIYLHEEAARAVAARFARALASGGWLFLAPTENLRGLSGEFDLRSSHGCFYYQARAAAASSAPEAAGDWHDEIERSSRRVATLASRPAVRIEVPGLELPEMLALLKAERFAEACAALDGLGADADATLLLARAAARLASGAAEGAEADCALLLARDGGDAGARLVLALCHAHRGDAATALAEARAAAHASPRSAMPRLHAGVLARRLGDAALAKRELALALELLPGEDESRLVLFGGGFDRGGLAAVCRSELAAIGAAS